jgi:esterase/lipase superfamily enzyme
LIFKYKGKSSMKILSWRLVWSAVLIALLISSVIAARYMSHHFIGLGPMPVRSAFSGRLPSVEGDRQLFRFFYATNRANTKETFDGRGNMLGDQISTGTFDVRISPYLPIKPFAWFDLKKMEWVDRNELAQEKFRSLLRQAIQASPKKSILVVVWGFRDWFQSAALRTAYTGYTLDIDTPVLLFDWPGNQGEGRTGYLASQQMATRSASDLGRVLAEVSRENGAENIWLIGSSLGCQTICDALSWLANQQDIPNKTKLAHVALSAPDVSTEKFNENFSRDIQKISQHLTVYVSSNDRALLMSQWINSGRRLGRKAETTIPPEDRSGQYEFEEALELLDLQAKGARNISIVDATPINRRRNLHHFFTDSPVFFDDLYQRLLRPDDIVSRRLHSVRTGPSGTIYWILWND